MPIDPRTLADFLQQAQQPQTVESGQPGASSDSGQLAQMFQQSQQPVPPATPPAQQTDTPAPQPDSTKLLLKPSRDNAPPSMQDQMLQGAYAASNGPGMVIPTYKDDTSPARSILANMFLGMGASLTGQKFQSIQERKYQRWKDQQELQLQQQQRNQQLQLGMGNIYAKMQKDQNNIAFKQQVEQIKNTKDTTTQQFLINKWEAQHQLDWAKYNQQNDRFEALKQHMNNQDKTDEAKLDPQIKNPAYLRALGIISSQYEQRGQDYNDSDIKPKFLQQVDDLTMAIEAKEAALKQIAGQKPPQTQMIGPDGKSFLVTPGTQVPAGSRTVTGESQMNMPTTATRRAGEQGGIIQTAGQHLIDVLDQNRNSVGDMESYWKKFKNGTPAADPTTSYINGLLQSYIALQPALHGFRSTQAMDHFEKAIGGVPKNVDALIAAIKATNETGGIVNAVGRGAQPSATSVPAVGGVFNGSKVLNVKRIK